MLDAPTRKNMLRYQGLKHPLHPIRAFIRFEEANFCVCRRPTSDFKGLISHLPEVYLRFEGLLIHVIGSINGYTSTSFRRFRAVSTWASAPRSGSRLPDKAKSAPRSRESTFLRCQKPTERKKGRLHADDPYDQFANRRSKRGLVLLFARRPVLRRRPYLSCRKSMAPEMDTVS